MASELRVNTINSRTGFGTITVSETGQDLVGITTIENLTTENTLVGAAASFTGNVQVGGVLTYEDVTNIDSVGLITARQGIEIGARPGVAASISADGNMIVSGVSTFGGAITANSTLYVGSDLTITDKIVHNGDTNTSLRFPSADTITAETGGTERFNIASDGKIYVGGSGASATAGELWFNDTSAYSSYIKQIAGSSALSFHTGQSQPERLRITSSGALGTNSTVRSANGGLDLCSQGATDLGTLTLGAGGGQNGQTRNTNTEHQYRIMMPTYADPSKMVTQLYGVSGSSGHEINYGGYTGWAYALNTHKFYTAADATTGNGTERLRIDSSGRTLVGAGAVATPKCDTGGIDIASGKLSIVMGGQTNTGDGTPRANAANKEARLALVHYTNAEEPIGLVYGTAVSGANNLNLGGGSSLVNAATEIKMWTAANTTTTAGSERMRIDSSGYIYRPNMPVFHAQSSPSRDGSTGWIHSFGSVGSNVGSHYDNSTGKFVAPVNGYYFFGFTLWCNDGSANDSTGTLATVTVYNSGNTYQRDAAAFNVMPGDAASYSLSAAASGVCWMAATDYAVLKSQFALRGSQPRNIFSGFLLHAIA